MKSTILLVLAACTPRGVGASSNTTPAPGISIAMYQADLSYAIVDDRRWVTFTGTSLVLDHVDPSAALASLLIEPLAGGALVVGRCARRQLEPPPIEPPPRRYRHDDDSDDERAVDLEPPLPIRTPEVRCDVGGDAGRHLVRVLYLTSALSFRVQHDLTMTIADRATVVTRFAIATPPWGGPRADVVLFDGRPGFNRPPHELARGTIRLDGSTSVLVAPMHEIAARLLRVFDGAMRNRATEETDAMWARESVHVVWVWLELPGTVLAPGPLRAHVELPGEQIRDIEVPARGRETTKDGLRFPLWIDEQLRGMRKRVVGGAEGASLVDRFVLSVINTGDAPREVWVEEHLRHARRREVTHAWPGKPTVAADRARNRLVIGPGAIERIGYVIEYSF